MSTELQKVETGIRLSFSQADVDLIKSQVAKGTTDDELKLFLYQCQRVGLNPLARQIYCIKFVYNRLLYLLHYY